MTKRPAVIHLSLNVDFAEACKGGRACKDEKSLSTWKTKRQISVSDEKLQGSGNHMKSLEFEIGESWLLFCAQQLKV